MNGASQEMFNSSNTEWLIKKLHLKGYW